jgi:uncharacterized protein
MARYEMAGAGVVGAEIAAMVPMFATGEAYYELGLMYAAGRTVPADLVEAHKWFNIAMARGCREAVAMRAELALEMSATEIALAQREARLWLARN